MKRRFLGSITGAGIALVCLLTACSGGITTSQPIDMSWGSTATAAAGTTERTAKPTTPSIPTYTTSSRSTTATKKPWSEYDPDPVMPFEEYMSEMRLADDGYSQYDYCPIVGRVFVQKQGKNMTGDEVVLDSLHTGSIYYWNETVWDGEGAQEDNYRLLRDCRALTYDMTSHMGYTYVAVDNLVYRYKNDGTDETLIFENDRPIFKISCDSYALFFTTDEGLYRLFRPTGQLDRLCDNSKPHITSLLMLTNDLLEVMYGTDSPDSMNWKRDFYIPSLDCQISVVEFLSANGLNLMQYTRSGYELVYEYCKRRST